MGGTPILRTHWLTSPGAAKAYYKQSDYYATVPGEWLGDGAKMLGLHEVATAEAFDQLCDNINPRTGLPLRPLARDDGRLGMDLTFNSTKSVGIVRELAEAGNAGDPMIEHAHREAVKYAMGFVEQDIQARVRVGGKNEDRTTGNMIAYRVTHRDTRISAEDQRPDMSLHEHVFVLNATYDPIEDKWKAAQMGQIKHDAPFYEAIYHNRLASNLRELGYGIRRKDKSFEIEGVSDALVQKFSRRREYIKAVAAKLGITSQKGMDKLGATTRLGKAKELADNLNGYYVSRLTGEERQQLAGLIGKPSYECSHEKAVRYAIGHLFHTRSVVEERKLYETALRHGIGSVTPEGVQAEARKQGVLLKDGEATTREVLAEERRIIDFAREGKGVCRPLGRPGASILDFDHLSGGQKNILRHLWGSMDRLMLVRGAAGTGKTTAMKDTLSRIDKPVAILAPSVDASRGVLRRDGFAEADTVAAFLGNKESQEKIKCGVIYVDEAGLLPISDLSRLVTVAEEQNARIILQGDPKQHKSITRHGDMFRALQKYAGLPVAELKDIRRQSGRYKEAVAAIEQGDILKGHEIFRELGWIEFGAGDAKLVEDYFQALATKKPGQDDRDRAIIMAPTHAEGREITEVVRNRLRDMGRLKGEDHVVERLVQQGWSDAEKDDPERYDGTEVIQFFRNSGQYKAGQRVSALDLRLGRCKPEHFAVFHRELIPLAVGDTIRTTSNINLDGKRVDNGSFLTVTGFTDKGGIETLSAIGTRRTLPADVGHINHGYVSTSYAGQGKTVDRVFAAMGHESLPALRTEQFYVDLSRARERATIYTDVPEEQLREAILRQDKRKSATELMAAPKRKSRTKDRRQKFVERAKDHFMSLRQRSGGVIRTINQPEREYYHGR